VLQRKFVYCYTHTHIYIYVCVCVCVCVCVVIRSSWYDKPFIIGDVEDKLILPLFTNILSVAVIQLF